MDTVLRKERYLAALGITSMRECTLTLLLSFALSVPSAWSQSASAQPSLPKSSPLVSEPASQSSSSKVPASRLDSFLPPPDAPFLRPVWPERVRYQGRITVVRDLGVPASRLFCSNGFFNSLLKSGIDSAESRLAKEQDVADLEALRRGFALAEAEGITPEGENATPVRIRAESPNRKPRTPLVGEPDSVQTFTVLSLHPTGPDQSKPEPALSRTTFALYAPIAPAAQGSDSAKRLVLLMPGIFGTPEQIIDPLVKHLRQNGCVVLRMLSQPSRFTEEVKFAINTASEAEWKAQAKRAAAVIDNRLAEVAYSADAALDHVYAMDASLVKLPHIIMGISGGAISLPPVVAQQPERWKAAVIMGGSADFWLTLSRSNYNDFIGAVQATWLPAEVNAASGVEARRSFDAEYLAHASLDPYHTASVFRGKPILFIQGSLDRAVPSALADILWSRLGEPGPPSERWKTPLSHETLFLTLPARFTEITGWMDRAIPTLPASDAASPAK